ncbi:5-hydroxytryptamine receptor 1-like [Copidosoma floridanum]|uniref:5-hydroxytryptamine receptor 1-like n=1 Tax=Copidosoma floridanum TaxID=29053 RepID=UPI0006C9A922|nr:5-hydroxytryptamine receptor 1-like [Copidosoma floridanum]
MQLVIIVLGNITAILTVMLSRGQQQSITSNPLILSLAVSDLLVGFAALYNFTVIDESLHDNKYPCLLRFVLLCGSCLTSFYNIVAIAVDRYIAILYPLKYQLYMTEGVISAMVIVIWSAAWMVSTVPFYWNTYDPKCECWLHAVVPRYYVMLVLGPIFLVVWLAITTLYWRIWKEARAYTRRKLTISTSTGQQCTPNYGKSNRVVLTILGCFSICWLPLMIGMLLQSFHVNLSITVHRAMYWAALCNSSANPIIYTWKNSTYRKTFCRLLRLEVRPGEERKQNEPTKRTTLQEPRTISTVLQVEVVGHNAAS